MYLIINMPVFFWIVLIPFGSIQIVRKGWKWWIVVLELGYLSFTYMMYDLIVQIGFNQSVLVNLFASLIMGFVFNYGGISALRRYTAEKQKDKRK